MELAYNYYDKIIYCVSHQHIITVIHIAILYFKQFLREFI